MCGRVRVAVDDVIGVISVVRCALIAAVCDCYVFGCDACMRADVCCCVLTICVCGVVVWRVVRSVVELLCCFAVLRLWCSLAMLFRLLLRVFGYAMIVVRCRD